MNITKMLKIYGRVQGVFFRESMSRQARQLGIAGWVKNCRDGTVEAMVQGSPDAVEQIIAWARIGPEMASVERVDFVEGWGEYSSFDRLGTD